MKTNEKILNVFTVLCTASFLLMCVTLYLNAFVWFFYLCLFSLLLCWQMSFTKAQQALLTPIGDAIFPWEGRWMRTIGFIACIVGILQGLWVYWFLLVFHCLMVTLCEIDYYLTHVKDKSGSRDMRQMVYWQMIGYFPRASVEEIAFRSLVPIYVIAYVTGSIGGWQLCILILLNNIIFVGTHPYCLADKGMLFSFVEKEGSARYMNGVLFILLDSVFYTVIALIPLGGWQILLCCLLHCARNLRIGLKHDLKQYRVICQMVRDQESVET